MFFLLCCSLGQGEAITKIAFKRVFLFCFSYTMNIKILLLLCFITFLLLPDADAWGGRRRRRRFRVRIRVRRIIKPVCRVACYVKGCSYVMVSGVAQYVCRKACNKVCSKLGDEPVMQVWAEKYNLHSKLKNVQPWLIFKKYLRMFFLANLNHLHIRFLTPAYTHNAHGHARW